MQKSQEGKSMGRGGGKAGGTGRGLSGHRSGSGGSASRGTSSARGGSGTASVSRPTKSMSASRPSRSTSSSRRSGGMTSPTSYTNTPSGWSGNVPLSEQSWGTETGMYWDGGRWKRAGRFTNHIMVIRSQIMVIRSRIMVMRSQIMGETPQKRDAAAIYYLL